MSLSPHRVVGLGETSARERPAAAARLLSVRQNSIQQLRHDPETAYAEKQTPVEMGEEAAEEESRWYWLGEN